MFIDNNHLVTDNWVSGMMLVHYIYSFKNAIISKGKI